jgi:alpha-L-rhamnosidase
MARRGGLHADALPHNSKLTTSLDGAITNIYDLTAKSVNETKPGSGTYIYDMGENVVGLPRITIPDDGYVSNGDELILRYAEILYPDNLAEYTDVGVDGTLMVENYRQVLSTDFYTATNGAQIIEPRYTFHGYRYIEISGLSKPLPKENVQMNVLSSVKTTATYESSNALVNRLFKNSQNSQESNFFSIITDCPQRNERMGWTGDAEVYARAAIYNADVYNIFREFNKNHRQEQASDGRLPRFAPSYPAYTEATGAIPNMMNYASGFGTHWEGSIGVLPYHAYQIYGDTAIIEENLDAIERYLDYLYTQKLRIGTTSINALTAGGSLADHLARYGGNTALLNNALYVYILGATAEMAEAIGETATAKKFSKRYEAGKEAWNEVFIDPDTVKPRTAAATPAINDRQSNYSLPLRYDIISDEYVERFVENYTDLIANPPALSDSNGALQPYTLMSGFAGTPTILPALSKYGHVEDAYKMFEQTEYASWLYPVVQGATSIWERWNSYTVENGFGGNNSMNSFNHFSLGAVTEWMMDYQLGISADLENPGFQHFILQPQAGGTFTYAKGTFESNYGTISSGWTASDGAMRSYECIVPANSTATLYLPASSVGTFQSIGGVAFNGIVTHNGIDSAEFALASGGYKFTVSGGNVSVALASGFVQPATPEEPTTPEQPAVPEQPGQPAPPTQQAPSTDVSVSMTQITVAGIPVKAYTGKQIKPVVTVSYKGTPLALGTDYTVAYGPNKSIGLGTVSITGKGTYIGAKSVSFKIVPKTNSVRKVTIGKKSAKVYFKKVSAAQKVAGYQIQYRQKGTAKWKVKTVSTKKSVVAIKGLKKGKRYQFRVRAYNTVAKVKYYAAWSATKTSKKIK